MYSLRQLKVGLSNPNLIARQANILLHDLLDINGLGQTVDVIKEDWDNLVIIDACRYDMFAEVLDGYDSPDYRISKASSTNEFLEENFEGRDLTDTVYVTANPVLYRRDDIQTEFHDVWNIWMEEGWNDDHGTVMPDTTEQYARKAAEEYPNKRLIVHFIQPHYPFVGSNTSFDKNHLPNPKKPHFWFQLMTGELQVDKGELWSAYNENLELVYPHARQLSEELEGKSVLTSDHGNMVGEPASPLPITEWGHPPGLYTEQLVKVPWIEFSTEKRKHIVSEAPSQGKDGISDSMVEQRLQDLGYVVE